MVSKRRTSVAPTPDVVNQWHPVRRMLHDYLSRPRATRVGYAFHHFLLLTILGNLVVLCMETLDGPNHPGSDPAYPYLPTDETYSILDAIFTSIFTLEIVLRAWTTPEPKVFWRDILTWFDIAAIIPFYFNAAFAGVVAQAGQTGFLATFLHIIKLFRVLRVVKMARHFYGTRMLIEAVGLSLEPLMITLFFLCILAMILATLIFYAEPCLDLETCQFTDIFNAGYFVTVTVSTVGFGDQVPYLYNPLSSGITVIAVILGSLFLSMPLAIIGNNFEAVWKAHEVQEYLKPNDGQDSHEAETADQQACHCKLVDLKHYIFVDDYYSLSEKFDSIWRRLSENKLVPDEAISTTLRIHTKLIESLDYFTTAAAREDAKQIASAESGKLSLGATKMSSKTISTLRRKVWTLLEKPESSRAARLLHRITLLMALGSIALFYSETMPEFHDYGKGSSLCKSVARGYCEAGQLDAGCLSQNEATLGERIIYNCRDGVESACYGIGKNFGSPDWSCQDAFTAEGFEAVCKRRECSDTHRMQFDAAQWWPYFEWLFGVWFSVELLLRFFVTLNRRQFLKNFYNLVDTLCILPFMFEIYDLIQTQEFPNYAIVASDTSFLAFIEMFKTVRVLKLARHFSGSRVLFRTLQLSWRRLTIPLFFLFIAILLFGGAFYEIERGKECFVGQECIWYSKNVLTPELINGAPNGTRILIQNDRPTIVKDLLHATWLALVTFTSVGYGRVVPRTSLGKFVAMIAMIFGACYTAMPLTLVGGQFYACYKEAQTDEAAKTSPSRRRVSSHTNSVTATTHMKLTDEEAIAATEYRRVSILLDDLRELEIKQDREVLVERFDEMVRILEDCINAHVQMCDIIIKIDKDGYRKDTIIE